MHSNENLISLTNHELKINKKEFIETIRTLPLIKYMHN